MGCFSLVLFSDELLNESALEARSLIELDDATLGRLIDASVELADKLFSLFLVGCDEFLKGFNNSLEFVLAFNVYFAVRFGLAQRLFS